ncbi:MAG: T9SS type A sorting domain-containing protein [Bacteroidetes bacterium]|nr:T9SS type A sorting domain-containing protein [Bacteroidota bacterium]
MKRTRFTTFLFSALILLLHFQSFSQSETFRCGTDEMRRQRIALHPEILAEEAKLEDFTKQYIQNNKSSQAQRSEPIIIPVVFHILHQGGAENISNEQIMDQLRILNTDYNKRNADTSLVIPSMQQYIGNIGIEFRLANIDPKGNITNGIDRINTVQTFVGDDYSKLSSWPREKYLNVWTAKTMREGAAGYAYYPGGVSSIYNTPSMDGIMILHNYVGSIGTSTPVRSRALTHEIGHYLNLKHTWGDTNSPRMSCGDDEVDDTPLTKGWDFCPYPQNAQECNPGVIENYQNYMDYSYCSNMFTEGQKDRMLAALSSTVSQRSNLYSGENLIATGVLNTVPLVGVPVADFALSKRYACSNQSVYFYDASDNAQIDEYYWEFDNASPSSSTLKNPVVQFLDYGWHRVSLTVRNLDNPDKSSTKVDSFAVFTGYSNGLYYAPYYEGFEYSSIFDVDWASVNYDQNNTRFQQTNEVSHTGTGSAFVNNYFTRANRDIDEIVSPGIDMSSLAPDQMTLSFFYSLASWNGFPPSWEDSLVVSASSDCGVNWKNIYKIGGTRLVMGSWVGSWKPLQEAGSWKKVNISIPSNLNLRQPNVRFRFQLFSSIQTNNFYLDDINIGNVMVTGLNETASIEEATLFPNPTNGYTILNLSLLKAGKVSVAVYDLNGREVMQPVESFVNEGMNRMELDGSMLNSGIYVLRIISGDTQIQRKLVKD